MCGCALIAIMEPEVNPVEEVETSPVDNAAPSDLIVGPEKIVAAKILWKPCTMRAVVAAVLG